MSSGSILQVPSGASGGLGLNFLIFFFTSKFHETSVTRSLTKGKAFIGAIVTGLLCVDLVNRVQNHHSFGDFRHVLPELATARIASEDRECRGVHYLNSSTI